MLVEISRSLYLQQLLITVVRMNTNWDTIKPVHPTLPVPHPDSISSCSPNPLFVSIFTLRAFPRQQAKLELSRQYQRTNFFKFYSRQTLSVPDPVYKTSQHSCQRTPSSISRIYSKLFHNFRIPEYCNKRQLLPF